MSSANNLDIRRSSEPGTSSPLSFDFRSISAKGSMARSKSKQDSGSPWHTPHVTLNGELRNPFTITLVCAFSSRYFIVVMNWAGFGMFLRLAIGSHVESYRRPFLGPAQLLDRSSE